MARVAVLGGGISGLSAAYYLTRAPASKIKQVVLLESTSRLGGWIQTSRFDDGSVFEQGARNLTLTGKPGKNTLLLAEDLGLEDELIACTKANKSAGNQYIYVDQQIHQVPNSLKTLFTRQPPFSRSLVAQCWKEPFTRSVHKDDETIHDFITRRLGHEVASYLFDPISRAIFNGTSRELSMKACFKDIFHWEQQYGSIIKGAIRAPKDKTKLESALLRRAKKEGWKMWSTRNGLQRIPEALHTALSNQGDRAIVHTNAPCTGIARTNNQLKVTWTGGEDSFDHVFAALPAPKLAATLHGDLDDVREDLTAIGASTVGVVNLQYEGDVLPHKGVGHLVPTSETDTKVSAILYESCIFPQHGATDTPTTRLTVTMGGSEFTQLFGPPDDVKEETLVDTAVTAVRHQLGVTKSPTRTLVRVQKECLPQYVVGHVARVQRLTSSLSSLPLSLIGASYRGVSVNDCVWNARCAVDDVLTAMTSWPSMT